MKVSTRPTDETTTASSASVARGGAAAARGGAGARGGGSSRGGPSARGGVSAQRNSAHATTASSGGAPARAAPVIRENAGARAIAAGSGRARPTTTAAPTPGDGDFAPGGGATARVSALLRALPGVANTLLTNKDSLRVPFLRALDAALSDFLKAADAGAGLGVRARRVPLCALALARALRIRLSRLPPDIDEASVCAALTADVETTLAMRVTGAAASVGSAASWQTHDKAVAAKPCEGEHGSVHALCSSSVVVLLGRGAAALAVLTRTAELARAAGDPLPRVVVIESAVQGEAGKTLRKLHAAGYERITFAPFSSLCAAVASATVILLSAVDVLADGALVGRAGSAALAAAARAAKVPVFACAESFKFVDRALASPDAAARNEAVARAPDSPAALPVASAAKGASPADVLAAVPWTDAPTPAPAALPTSVTHCAPLLDVTPAAFITAFLTDATTAPVPPRVVGVIARSNNDEDANEKDDGADDEDEAESSGGSSEVESAADDV